MENTIIAIHGRAGEGKSDTIKRACQLILTKFPNTEPSSDAVDYSGDVNLIITICGVKIGIESQGDPNSRMFHTIESFAKEGCSIILCATRTAGATVKKVDEVADKHNYNTLWISSYYSPKLNWKYLNNLLACNLVEVMTDIMNGKLGAKPVL